MAFAAWRPKYRSAEPAAKRSGRIAQVDSSDTYYYLGDGLGSVMKTTDDTGTAVNAYDYDVYGTVTSSSGWQTNEFEFAGEQTDPSGLQYLRARYYDSETGTFISRDPLSAMPGWVGHPFGYASSDPVGRVDPLGLFDCEGLSGVQCRREIMKRNREVNTQLNDEKGDESDGVICSGPGRRRSPNCPPQGTFDLFGAIVDLVDAVGSTAGNAYILESDMWQESGALLTLEVARCAADVVCAASVSGILAELVWFTRGTPLWGPLLALDALWWLGYSGYQQGKSLSDILESGLADLCVPSCE